MIQNILVIFISILSINSHAQTQNTCLKSVDKILTDGYGIVNKIKNTVKDSIALSNAGVQKEVVDIELLAARVTNLLSHAIGIGREIEIKRTLEDKNKKNDYVDSLITNHAKGMYVFLKSLKDEVDDNIPFIKDSNLREDVRQVRNEIDDLLKKYKACDA